MTRVIIKQNNKEIIIPDVHETIKAIEQSMLSIQDVLGSKESTSNRVTSLSSQSTNNQYPSAKCVFDYIDSIIGDINDYITS